MPGKQIYEAPRLKITTSSIDGGSELIRWICESRKLGYDEGRRPLLSTFDLEELPEVAFADGSASGLTASIELLDARFRFNERILGESSEEREHLLQRLAYFDEKLTREAVRLWMHFIISDDLLLKQFENNPNARIGNRKDNLANCFGLDNFIEEDAWQSVFNVLSDVESCLASRGSLFLSGDCPGSEDIFFAALVSPIVVPEQCGIRFPTLDKISIPLKERIEQARATKAGQLAISTYQAIRPDPQPKLPAAVYGPTFTERLVSPWLVRKIGSVLARRLPRFSIGKTLVVSGWSSVTEVLDRDNEFLIAPVNGKRIEAVSGPFILGMDRCPELFSQREHIYSALRDADKKGFLSTLESESNALLDTAEEKQVDVVNGYARLVAGRTAAKVFGVYGPTEQDLLRVLRSIFHETFLNQGGDARVREEGVAAGKEFRAWIDVEIARRMADNRPGDDVLGKLIASSSTDSEAIRWMLAGLQVGAVDTTTTAVTYIVSELLADRRLREAMVQDLDSPRRFLGWCWEALRRRPHNYGLLREAGRNASVAGNPVAEGRRVLLLTAAAMHDPAVFDDPHRLRPDRPLDWYLHFGRGLHQCSGRDFNVIQIPLLVRELLRRNVSGRPSFRTRGPFPDELIVSIQPLK